MKLARCRHRDTWLVAGGSYEWCYNCGAFRTTRETGPAQVTPSSPWCRPTGPAGENPWARWDRRRTAYQARKKKGTDGS